MRMFGRPLLAAGLGASSVLGVVLRIAVAILFRLSVVASISAQSCVQHTLQADARRIEIRERRGICCGTLRRAAVSAWAASRCSSEVPHHLRPRPRMVAVSLATDGIQIIVSKGLLDKIQAHAGVRERELEELLELGCGKLPGEAREDGLV